MAQNFADRLTLDDINQKILREKRQKISGFSLFKTTFFGQLRNMMKANWFMLIFCLPAAGWLFWTGFRQGFLDSAIPYSANIGIGYPIVSDAAMQGLSAGYSSVWINALTMFLLIIVLFAGLSGVFNVVKYYLWSMPIKMVKTSLRGIKNSYGAFMWAGLLLGALYVLYVYFSYAFPINNVEPWIRTSLYVLIGVLAVVILMLLVFVLPQAAMFNLSIFQMFKNAFTLAFKFIVPTFFVMIAGLLPYALLLISFVPIVQVIAYMLFFMFAFSWTATIWTIYAQFVFDSLYQESKPSDEQKKNNSNPKKKQKKAEFVNPKKKKKIQ